MIGLFPTPYPDELWYSVCARYSKILNLSCEGFCYHLFDKTNLKISIDLPSSLKKVVSKLPPNHHLSVDRIINNHTHLPFYAHFLPVEKVSKLWKLMINNNGKTIHTISGISPSVISIPKYLKFCPICIREDNKSFGVSYWHRLPQVPGVFVCPNHKVFLEDSIIRVVNSANKIQLFCPDNNLEVKDVRKLDLENKVHCSLLSIAENVRWLLDRKISNINNMNFQQTYFELFIEKGFYNKNKGIQVKKLAEHIKNHFSDEFLEIINSRIETDKSNWVNKLSTYLTPKQCLIPMRQLLLISALGETPESFFSRVSSTKSKTNSISLKKDFINGPYPCLNPICDNFYNLIIENYEVIPDTNSKENFIIIGCKCGFKYRRKGKDKSTNDIFRKTRTISYGKLWENKLIELWTGKDLSLSQISKILGVRAKTLKCLAASIGLKFPRITKDGIKTDLNTQIRKRLDIKLKNKINKTKFISTRNIKRKTWLTTIKSNPNATITKLRNSIAPSLTQWLFKVDREWLNNNKPQPAKKTVDWESRDRIGVETVNFAVKKLLAREGKPIWVCKYKISSFFEKPNWIIQDKFLNKMPLTKKLLNEVSENRLSYNLRKIRWAVNEIKKENGSAKAYLIAEKAHVHVDYRNVYEIKSALETGQEEIELSRLNQF